MIQAASYFRSVIILQLQEEDESAIMGQPSDTSRSTMYMDTYAAKVNQFFI